jgi:pimeloyl-ACP methyl ester carboxylesterase
MTPRRLLALAAAVLLASACSGPGLPQVPVASRAVAATPAGTTLQDEKLAGLLAEAATRPAATREFLLALQSQLHPRDWSNPLIIAGTTRSFSLRFDEKPVSAQGSGPEWSPSSFDRLIPADAFPLEGYSNIHAAEGVGVPFVLAFEDTESLRKFRPFRPGNDLCVPATAVLEFDRPSKSTTGVRLHLFNTDHSRTARLQGRTARLAYHLTASVEANLDNPYIRDNGLAGLLNPDKRDKDTGLFGLSSYDPEKIPVLFVHGLNSDPHIWKDAVNEILGQPDLSARYQPLLFMYPTGLPVPAAAARLRESIATFRSQWDPDQNDPGFEQMVLVGHSMGGLLSRLQVVDPGDELWKAFFARPPSEIPWLSATDRKRISGSLEFQPTPFVRRVVFVAVPHRGSSIADFNLVQFAIRLIKIPQNTANYAATALLQDPGLLNPALLQYNSLGLRSVDMLSPGHPYFQALEKMPIPVPHHSIIGDRGKGNTPASSDGVVRYWSSSLATAASEKIVPHSHSCTGAPETVEEISRILRLHARL